MGIVIREIKSEDRGWLKDFFIKHWGSTQMVYSQGIHECDQLQGYAAWDENEVVGVVTIAECSDFLEVVSLDSIQEGRGIGTVLMETVEKRAVENQYTRIWLLTTNDNLKALGFYQKRGYELVQIHRRAVDLARRIKPQIPLVATNGIPIRDEIELEKWIML